MLDKNSTILIPDEKLMTIPIKDNGDVLVNLRNFNKEIAIEIEEVSKKMQKLKENECFVRRRVALMLDRAQADLPVGLKLKIIDGYRPLSAQKMIYRQIFDDIKNKNPGWPLEKVTEETDKWVANPKIVPFHTTGGAVDLTITDGRGKELDMGTPINSISEKSGIDSKGISEEAVRNRNILSGVMSKAGFINLPSEWWHWSYGDRYWAAVNNTHSIYGAI